MPPSVLYSRTWTARLDSIFSGRLAVHPGKVAKTEEKDLSVRQPERVAGRQRSILGGEFTGLHLHICLPVVESAKLLRYRASAIDR